MAADKEKHIKDIEIKIITTSQFASEKWKLVENPQAEVSNHDLVGLINKLEYNMSNQKLVFLVVLSDIKVFQQQSN